MKITFSLHLRTFMTGVIISLSLIVLLISLPDIEYTILGDELDDDNGFYIFIFSFIFIFFSYGIGMLLEIISTPLPNSAFITKHLDSYLKIFTHNDHIIQESDAYHAINQDGIKGKLSDLKVYKYIYTYILSRNDNISREIQGCLFKIYTMTSLFIATLILSLSFFIKVLFTDIYFDDALVFNIAVIILLVISMLLTYNARQKSKKLFIEEIEQAYYILTKCSPRK